MLRTLGLLLAAVLAAARAELLFVHVVFRHGERTIINPYPNDPYKNMSYWPEGLGQLTANGKRQQHLLGQFFRQRYKDFLPLTYSRDDVYVRSSNVDRTLMSAEAHMSGLYPPFGSDVWDPAIAWQPIPVHTIPEKMDAVVAGQKPCKKYERLYQELLQSETIRRIDAKYAPLYAYLTNSSGLNVTDLFSLEILYDTLNVEQQRHLQLPPWTAAVFPAAMRPAAELLFTLQTYNEALQRLRIGPLLQEMVQRMQERAAGRLSPARRYWLYSGHDTTVAALLMGLGAFQPHSPPYCSSVLLELHAETGRHVVRAFYKNGSELQALQVRGCPVDCPLEELAARLAPLLVSPKVWEEECRDHSSNGASNSSSNSSNYFYWVDVVSGAGGAGLALAGLLLLAAVLSLCYVALRSRPADTLYLRIPSEET